MENSNLNEADFYVDTLYNSLNKVENLKDVPKYLREVLVKQFWKKRRVKLLDGEIVECKKFEEFVTATYPRGLGTTIAFIKRLCVLQDGKPDYKTLDLIDKEIRKPQGRPTKEEELGLEEQKNRNNVTVLPPIRGNSIGYSLKRLREVREDLYEKVLKGEMSTNEAMIEAGLRKRNIVITARTETLGKAIKNHFTPTQIEELIEYLSSEK